MALKEKLKVKSQKSKLINKILFFIVLAIIILNLGSTVWGQKEKYTSNNYWQKFPQLEKKFLDSQYVNKNPNWIRDEVAFSYAGGMLITGTNPVLVVPDAPPLGKYMIGLSAVIFNNDSIIVLVSAVLSLILLYFLSFQIFSNRMLSIIPPLFLSFEPIFKNQLIYTPLMDMFQLFFLLCTFYFFNKGLSDKKNILFFALANLFLGFSMANKFFITGFVVIAAFYSVLFFSRDKKKLINLTISIPLPFIILLLTYIRVFAFDYTINKFLGIQKWVFLYHKSFLILPFSVWPLLLFNKWYVWFGNEPVISDSQWTIAWPIIAIISFVTIALYLFQKIPRNKNIEILMAWSALYLIFLSFGQISSRYFVILIPILYIISLYGLISVYKVYKK